MVFGALWDTATTFGNIYEEELGKAFDNLGLNDKNPEELAAFVHDKPELFARVTELATIKALWLVARPSSPERWRPSSFPESQSMT